VGFFFDRKSQEPKSFSNMNFHLEKFIQKTKTIVLNYKNISFQIFLSEYFKEVNLMTWEILSFLKASPDLRFS